MTVLKFGSLEFDDWVEEPDKTIWPDPPSDWSQVCQKHLQELYANKAHITEEPGAVITVCGVKGCEEPSEYYINFTITGGMVNDE